MKPHKTLNFRKFFPKNTIECQLFGSQKITQEVAPKAFLLGGGLWRLSPPPPPFSLAKERTPHTILRIVVISILAGAEGAGSMLVIFV